MSVPKFVSITLDTPSNVWHSSELSQEEILPRHYVGLLKSMPNAEHPEGVELSGAGYQRQYFEPNSPTQKLEWSAVEDWNSVTGYIVYDKFQGGTPLMWRMFFRELHIFKGETAVVHYTDLEHSLRTSFGNGMKTKEPTFK